MMKYIIVLNVVMRHVSVSVFLVIGLVAALSATEPLPGQRPNILMIPVDDMNDWIGPLGGLDIAITPNLDRLAAMGMTFTNAHCASPACAPSRLAVMSGVRPSRSGVMQNIWEDGPFWRDLPALDGVQVLEEFFQNNGYRTMGGGKIYHSLQWTDISQVDATVWDEYYPSAEQNIPHQIRAPEWITNPSHFWGKRHKYFLWGPIAAADEVMADYQVVDWALSKLK